MSTTRAVPRGILDHGDLPTGRDVEHLGHDGRRSDSPLPWRDRNVVAADERHPFAPDDVRVGAVVDTRERPKHAAAADVPDAHCAIGAERCEARPVRAEPSGEDAAAMRVEDTNRIAVGGVPEPYDAIGVSGCDELPVRAVPDGEDVSCVPDEPRERPTGEHVTDAHRLPVGCDQTGAVGRDGDAMEDPEACLSPDGPLCRQHARGSERVVQGLLGLDEHAAVVPSRRLGGLDREQDAALGIDGEVRLGGGSQLAGRREACVVPRLSPEDERERGERRGRGGKEREPGERRPSPPCPPPCGGIRRRARLGEECALAGGQSNVGRSCPGLELRQPALARQVLRITVLRRPTPRRPRRDAGGGAGARDARRSTRAAGPTGTGSPRVRPRRWARVSVARGRR